MFITVHAAAGALIGTEITNPFWAFIVSFLAHFAMDIVPHGDQKNGSKFFGMIDKKLSEEQKFFSMAAFSLIDAIVVIFSIIFYFKTFYFAKDDSVIWGIIGGIIPDLLVAFYMVSKFKPLRSFFKIHAKIHHAIVNRIKYEMPMKVGLIMQLIVMTAILAMLFHINVYGPYF